MFEDVHFGVLGREFGQVGADVVALVVEFVTADAGCGFEELLADFEVVGSVRKVHHVALQVIQLPVGIAAKVFQKIVFHFQRVGSQVGCRIRFVGWKIGDDVEGSIHATPVAGVGADVGINSRFLRHFKEDGVGLLGLDKFAGDQNLVTLRDEVASRCVGISTGGFSQFTNFGHKAWQHDRKVVRHIVGICQPELDGPTSLDSDGFAIVDHPLANCAKWNQGHNNFRKLLFEASSTGSVQPCLDAFGKLQSQLSLVGVAFTRFAAGKI